MKKALRYFFIYFSLTLFLSLSGCEGCSREQSTEEKIEKAAEDTGEAIEERAEEVGDAVEEGAEEVGDAVEEGAEEVEETVDSN